MKSPVSIFFKDNSVSDGHKKQIIFSTTIQYLMQTFEAYKLTIHNYRKTRNAPINIERKINIFSSSTDINMHTYKLMYDKRTFNKEKTTEL